MGPLPRAAMIGRTISHYVIDQQLGEGGMGVVYRARDARLGRDVALKFIRTDLIRDENDRKRFFREARALAALDHPNVCTLHAIEEAEDHVFLVMALAEGVNLRQLVATQPLDPVTAIAIVRQVALGITAAHERGIVHRDMKCSNVMVAPDMRVKILDFGLATVRGAETLTSQGNVVGTLAYMAPEQLRGEPVDPRADIWALGVLLYEVVTGELPFHASHQPAILYRILNENPAPLAERCGDFGRALQSILDRALSKNANDRFATASEFVAALDAIAVPSAGSARVAQPAAGAHRPVDAGADEHTVAVLNFANISGVSQFDWLSTGIPESITTDLKRIDVLTVLPRDRVARLFSGAAGEPPVAEIGRTVGARWLVWGAFQQAGTMIRITAHLADANHASVAHSLKVDGPMDSIFALQDRIVLGLAEAMDVRVSKAERDQIQQPETKAPHAYELAARARYLFSRGNMRDLEEAQELYQRALELDSSYALAHSGLGALHVWRFVAHADAAALAGGVRHLEKAIEIDPGLGDAYVWLTYFRTRAGDIAGAIQAGRRAVEMEERSVFAHYFLGLALADLSGPYDAASVREGMQHLRRATQFSDAHEAAFAMLGCLSMLHGQYDAAERAFDRALELERAPASAQRPFIGAYTLRGTLQLRRGAFGHAEKDFTDALAALARSAHVYASTFTGITLCGLGETALRRGRFDEAVGFFGRALDTADRAPRQIGVGHVAVRAHGGVARASLQLEMMRETRVHLTAAEELLALGAASKYSTAWAHECCNAFSYYDLALALLDLGKTDEALGALSKAVDFGFRDAPKLYADRWAERIGDRAEFEALAQVVSGLA